MQTSRDVALWCTWGKATRSAWHFADLCYLGSCFQLHYGCDPTPPQTRKTQLQIGCADLHAIELSSENVECTDSPVSNRSIAHTQLAYLPASYIGQ